MAIVCPTVLAADAHEYREQLERIQPFAKRIQIDMTDGDFAPTRTIDLSQLWWSDSDKIDVHLMYRKPTDVLLDLVRLNPHMVIVHAEADGSFFDITQELHDHDIKTGVALLKETPVQVIADALDVLDHVLIFSGDLGRFGGVADLELLDKVTELKRLKPQLEVGWDGGINDKNIRALTDAGVDVCNVGGFIQKAESPARAYGVLKKLV